MPQADIETLYVTEPECARRIGFGIDTWRTLAPKFEQIGMARIDPLTKRRYWPAVRAFLDRHNGLVAPDCTTVSPNYPEDKENLDALNKAKNRRGARPGTR